MLIISWGLNGPNLEGWGLINQGNSGTSSRCFLCSVSLARCLRSLSPFSIVAYSFLHLSTNSVTLLYFRRVLLFSKPPLGGRVVRLTNICVQDSMFGNFRSHLHGAEKVPRLASLAYNYRCTLNNTSQREDELYVSNKSWLCNYYNYNPWCWCTRIGDTLRVKENAWSGLFRSMPISSNPYS